MNKNILLYSSISLILVTIIISTLNSTTYAYTDDTLTMECNNETGICTLYGEFASTVYSIQGILQGVSSYSNHAGAQAASPTGQFSLTYTLGGTFPTTEEVDIGTFEKDPESSSNTIKLSNIKLCLNEDCTSTKDYPTNLEENVTITNTDSLISVSSITVDNQEVDIYSCAYSDSGCTLSQTTKETVNVKVSSSITTQTITINGEEGVSKDVSLEYGSNKIIIVTTSKDKTQSQTYTLNISRSPVSTSSTDTETNNDTSTTNNTDSTTIDEDTTNASEDTTINDTANNDEDTKDIDTSVDTKEDTTVEESPKTGVNNNLIITLLSLSLAFLISYVILKKTEKNNS